MIKPILQVCFALVILQLTAAPATAQRGQGTFYPNVPAGSVTLYYTVLVGAQADPQCGNLLITSKFSTFFYTVAGTTTALRGSGTAWWSTCTGVINNAPISLWGPNVEIVFTPSLQGDWAGNWSGGSAETTPLSPGILYPKYHILSLIYDPPGNLSSEGYTASRVEGSTNSIEPSFQYGDSVTYSPTEGALGLADTLGWSMGISETTGNSAAWTETISQASGVSNSHNSRGSNALNHRHDLFIIWLNPAITVYQSGPTAVTYGVSTRTQTNSDPAPGQPEAVDAVEVYAGSMMANAEGATSVPLRVLQPQVVSVEANGAKSQEILPGLASICANQSYYPNRCEMSPNQQCGCVPADFTAILSADSLLGFASTNSPLKANTPTNPTRFVTINSASLLGPSKPGGNRPANSFTETDAAHKPEQWPNGHSYSVGFTWEQPWTIAGSGPSLEDTSEFTFSSTESVGKINGEAHMMAVSLSSDTVGCSENVAIFEDTVYHTFAFQQSAGNTTCP